MTRNDVDGVDDEDDGRDRVAAWFGRRLEERPRRKGPAPAQQDWDVSGEWRGASYKMIQADQQIDPYLPHVRLPGREDERHVAAGFRQGIRGVDRSFVEPIEVEEYEPDDGIDLSRYKSF